MLTKKKKNLNVDTKLFIALQFIKYFHILSDFPHIMGDSVSL